MSDRPTHTATDEDAEEDELYLSAEEEEETGQTCQPEAQVEDEASQNRATIGPRKAIYWSTSMTIEFPPSELGRKIASNAGSGMQYSCLGNISQELNRSAWASNEHFILSLWDTGEVLAAPKPSSRETFETDLLPCSCWKLLLRMDTTTHTITASRIFKNFAILGDSTGNIYFCHVPSGRVFYHELGITRVLSIRIERPSNDLNDDKQIWVMLKSQTLIKFQAKNVVSIITSMIERSADSTNITKIDLKEETAKWKFEDEQVPCMDFCVAPVFKTPLTEWPDLNNAKLIAQTANELSVWDITNEVYYSPIEEAATYFRDQLKWLWSSANTASADKATPSYCLERMFKFHDSQRRMLSMTVDPSSRYAVISDSLGRLILVSLCNLQILWIWKGYRNAKVAWHTQENCKYRSVAFYSALRNTLEVWKIPSCELQSRVYTKSSCTLMGDIDEERGDSRASLVVTQSPSDSSNSPGTRSDTEQRHSYISLVAHLVAHPVGSS